MSNRTLGLDDRLYDYMLDHSLREPDLFRRLREETAKDSMSVMQIAPEQGQFMALIVKAIGARRCIEVGVYTGYSALSVAAALPADGRIVACDISEEWTNVGKRYWEEAGVVDKIDLRLAPAVDTLDQLINDGQSGSFDFAFIDADKVNYINYYERCLELLRTGGLIVVDNVFWSGDVADPGIDETEDLAAIRAFNDHVTNDERCDLSMIPVADGLTLARKR
ncbi:MAG: class I SAM-dependent methyltransferase [Gammaproteobacteria bacterium]